MCGWNASFIPHLGDPRCSQINEGVPLNAGFLYDPLTPLPHSTQYAGQERHSCEGLSQCLVPQRPLARVPEMAKPLNSGRKFQREGGEEEGRATLRRCWGPAEPAQIRSAPAPPRSARSLKAPKRLPPREHSSGAVPPSLPLCDWRLGLARRHPHSGKTGAGAAAAGGRWPAAMLTSSRGRTW